jgi:hypothetical protein
MEIRMTEIVEFWEFNFDLNIITHLPCGMVWFVELDNHVSEKVKGDCLDHQKICSEIKSPLDGQVSREEWEDNIQKSREKDKIDKRRDDIFKQIFN